MSDRSLYDDFGDELRDVDREPNILDHNQVLAMISRRCAARLSQSDGRPFREQLRLLAKEADLYLSDLVTAEEEGKPLAAHGGKLSSALLRIQELTDSGLADLDAELEFIDVVEKVLKRVEKYEELKSQRINALSAAAVRTMIETFGRILRDYLPRERAQQAYAELMSHYPKNAEEVAPRVLRGE